MTQRSNPRILSVLILQVIGKCIAVKCQEIKQKEVEKRRTVSHSYQVVDLEFESKQPGSRAYTLKC